MANPIIAIFILILLKSSKLINITINKGSIIPLVFEIVKIIPKSAMNMIKFELKSFVVFFKKYNVANITKVGAIKNLISPNLSCILNPCSIEESLEKKTYKCRIIINKVMYLKKI